jgi:hypothetical protein
MAAGSHVGQAGFNLVEGFGFHDVQVGKTQILAFSNIGTQT